MNTGSNGESSLRLVRFGELGQEKPGIIGLDGVLRDLSSLVADIDPTTLSSLFDQIEGGIPAVVGSPRLGTPIARPGKIVAVGLNYRDHCEECGYPIPSEPILFSKAVTAFSGPNDAVVLPKGCTKTD